MTAGVYGASLKTRGRLVLTKVITALGFGGNACSLLRCVDACCLPPGLLRWQHLCICM